VTHNVKGCFKKDLLETKADGKQGLARSFQECFRDVLTTATRSGGAKAELTTGKLDELGDDFNEQFGESKVNRKYTSAGDFQTKLYKILHPNKQEELRQEITDVVVSDKVEDVARSVRQSLEARLYFEDFLWHRKDNVMRIIELLYFFFYFCINLVYYFNDNVIKKKGSATPKRTSKAIVPAAQADETKEAAEETTVLAQAISAAAKKQTTRFYAEQFKEVAPDEAARNDGEAARQNRLAELGFFGLNLTTPSGKIWQFVASQEFKTAMETQTDDTRKSQVRQYNRVMDFKGNGFQKDA
jgi:hypothetical protein